MEKTKLVSITDGVTARVEFIEREAGGEIEGIVKLRGVDESGKPFSLIIRPGKVRELWEAIEGLAEEIVENRKADEEGR